MRKNYYCIKCGTTVLPQRKYCLSCREDMKKNYKHRRIFSTYEYTKNSRKELKNFSIEYLGGKCSKCGYNKSHRALVFHHRDPSEKDFAIGRHSFYTIKKEKLIEELDKCDLLCSNCHGEIHDELENNSRFI